jgi:hypothetical protein
MKVIAKDVNSGKKIEAHISDENYEALQSLAQDKISDTKLQSFLENLEMSADAKALIASILKTAIKVGNFVIRVGKRIVEIIIMIATKFPKASFGLLLGLLIGALVASIPLLGFILGQFVTPIAAIFGLARGYFEDLKDQALARKIDEAVAMFQPLNGEINVAS